MRILEVSGKNYDFSQHGQEGDIVKNQDMIHSVLIDEGYSAVSGHVDANL